MADRANDLRSETRGFQIKRVGQGMLERIGIRIAKISRRIVPNTFLLAVFLTLVTVGLCLVASPLGGLDVLEIWAGSGSHPLWRGPGEGVITKIEETKEKKEKEGEGKIVLYLWKKTSPGVVVAALQRSPLLRGKVVRIEGRTILLKGITKDALHKELEGLRVPAKIRGIWHFLSFSMQMCLILVLGYALAVSRPVMRLIRRFAEVPSSGAFAAGWVAFWSLTAGWLNWGFGLIFGAYLAREVGRRGEERGIPMHYPLLGAAGYTALLIWHGGLSGSAPLKVAEAGHITKELGLEINAIPLTQTIFSPLNLAVCLGLLLCIPLLCRAMMPSQADEIWPASRWVGVADTEDFKPIRAASWLDHWRGLNVLLAFPLLATLALYIGRHGAWFSIDQVILLFCALGLLAYPDVQSYLRSINEGAKGCGGILLQFPLYAGIFALMYESSLVERIASSLASIRDPSGFLLVNFFSAGVLNLFIPSGGGQWGIQGPIVLAAAKEAGVPLGSAVMTVAYGDQWTNMMQPFWAIALLEITGLRARDIIAYTLLLMVAAGLLIALALLLFGRVA